MVSDGTDEQHAISSDISGAGQVIERQTVLVSQRNGRPGNDYGFEPTISANGPKIAYATWATNLTGTRDRNKSVLDVVVTNINTGRTIRV